MSPQNTKTIEDVYIRFSVHGYEALDDMYMADDQEHMQNSTWDYKNTNSITNQIKNAIEEIDLEKIQDAEERYWLQQILWMWYHHAISCALYRYGDKEAAQTFACTALKLQPNNHPNKITQLLFFLVNDDLAAAQKWLVDITTEPEQGTAKHLIESYKRGELFKITNPEN